MHCHQIEFVHSIPLLTLEPHRVIFYRDDVSKGQFNQVLLHEIDFIRKSCASLGGWVMLALTMHILQYYPIQSISHLHVWKISLDHVSSYHAYTSSLGDGYAL